MSATIQIVLRTDKVNKSGEAPIHLRIIKHRKVTNISTGIKVQPKYWDEVKKRVKTPHPNSTRFNAFLSNLLTEYTNKFLEAQHQDLNISAKAIKDKITGATDADLFTLGDEIVAKFDRNGKIGSRDKTRSVLKKIESYLGKRKLLLSDISEQWLTRYETYLIVKLQNRTNTVYKDMRLIRQIFNAAIRSDLLSSNKNPFTKYRMRTEKTSKEFLTLEEISAFADVQLPTGSKLSLFRDMFVFSSFAGGLRISDVLLLRWTNIVENRVVLRIKKTQSTTAFLMPDVALAIAQKYRQEPKTMQQLVFPALPITTDWNNPESLDRAISRVTASVNKSLKVIAKRAGIEKSISFHCSRHSFAVNALRMGIRIEYVSKILGHAAIRETQIYAQIANGELDKAMQVFN